MLKDIGISFTLILNTYFNQTSLGKIIFYLGFVEKEKKTENNIKGVVWEIITRRVCIEYIYIYI